MKAWQFTGVHQPLVLNDLTEPNPGPGELVIEVKAAGMCHSDVGVMESDTFVPFPIPVPITLGHEVAGVVVKVGEGVDEWQIGDRVAVALVGPPVGFARNGGYQDRILLAADDLVRIPDAVSFDHAAIATDAGVTAYLAMVTKGEVKSGDKVAIIGFGGLGQLGAQIAVALDAEVYVAEPKEAAWPEASRIGAARVAGSVGDFAGVEFDVIVDFAGFGTTPDAIHAVRPGGRIVQIGLGRQEATIDIWALVQKNVTLVGALGGTHEELAGVLALFAAGKLDPVISPISFEEIPAALDRLSAGKVQGRVVAQMNR